MLAFKSVKIVTGSKTLFTIDHIELETGIVALVGRNGAGKSTFLRTIIGLHDHFSGSITVNDKSIESYSSLQLARQIAIVYSKAVVFGNHTGRDVIILGRLPYQNAFARATAEDHEKVEDVIQLLGISEIVDQEFGKMSDGEKQLVMIGRALVQETNILLLDEPGAFLDVVNRFKLNEIIQKIAKDGKRLILFSTHEIEGLERRVGQVLLIDQGEMKQLQDPARFKEEIYGSFGINSGII